MSDRIGQQLGNYRLVSMIGRGGFAEVYLGEHVYLKTKAAIKVLRTRLAGEDRESFLTEAQTIAHLQHNHIVSILEFGVQENMPFLIMEYAPNGTLRQRHPRGKPLSLETILRYVRQVSDAMQYAHEEKLIHRDIKPENLLLGSNSELLLSDFGVALVVKSSRYQEKEEVVGTIAYMAPEQLQGHPRPASDQYALGIVIYEWLSGDRPFLGSFPEIASQHLLTPPPPLHERVPTISPAVEEIVMIALAKDPQQRFASVHEFADALEQVSLGKEFVAPSLVANQPMVLAQSSAAPSLSPLSDLKAYKATPPSSESNLQDTPQLTAQLQQSSLSQVAQRARTRRALSRPVKTLLVVLVLLVIGGTGFIYFTMLLRPANSTAQIAPHPKVSIFQDSYSKATTGKPTIDDSLGKESIIGWAAGGFCTFKDGALHANKPASNGEAPCIAFITNVSNFAYQVQMTFIKGVEGGLVFRASSKGNYVFIITTDGRFALLANSFKSNGTAFSSKILLQHTNSALKAGLNQSNLLTVIAHESNIYLYINKQYVANVSDSTLLSGAIGVDAVGLQSGVDVAFSNLQVWTLE